MTAVTTTVTIRGTAPTASQSATVGHAPSSKGTTPNASTTPTIRTTAAATYQRFTPRA